MLETNNIINPPPGTGVKCRGGFHQSFMLQTNNIINPPPGTGVKCRGGFHQSSMLQTNNIINPPPRTRQTRIYIFWIRSNIRLIWVIGCVGAGLQDCLRSSNIVGKTRPYRMREDTTSHFNRFLLKKVSALRHYLQEGLHPLERNLGSQNPRKCSDTRVRLLLHYLKFCDVPIPQ